VKEVLLRIVGQSCIGAHLKRLLNASIISKGFKKAKKNKYSGVEKRQVARYFKSVAIKNVGLGDSVYDDVLDCNTLDEVFQLPISVWPLSLKGATLQSFRRSKFYKPRKHVKKQSDDELFIEFVQSLGQKPCSRGLNALKRHLSGNPGYKDAIVQYAYSGLNDNKEGDIFWLYNRARDARLIPNAAYYSLSTGERAQQIAIAFEKFKSKRNR